MRSDGRIALRLADAKLGDGPPKATDLRIYSVLRLFARTTIRWYPYS